ncbi:hypothetical protein [Clostridium botulinum]|uniref:Uncharacterized protein n=2 Tax=Clostridium botulinum TaxID=1491 RepID=A0A9Q1ZBR8_CLOBO|nr:hypothetical protein [Clostridium botulinum]KLU74516.1 hypothetical protein CBC3_13320 [Clostridium botulinum V891]KEH96833.1 hypothetical protein Z953_13895 [Clostridium botulinum D str. 16868]KOA73658.1 hypothetical protein ADU78_11810 [Clostridium botulinum]KOA75377.1 hypothetical protein ADU77_11065 [Clostridium botulinum]KOA84093.1 hypothetical protein ADU74_11625 [Clostridium botulinum]
MINPYCTENNIYTYMNQYTNNGTYTLEVKNNGFFPAQVVFICFYKGVFVTRKSPIFNYDKTYQIKYPKTACQISVTIYNNNTNPPSVMCQKLYPQGKDIRILLWGTGTATSCTEPDNSNSNCKNLCRCCRQAMHMNPCINS